MSGLMQGKRGLIMGLANDKSLAWGIAKKLADEGAELAFSYQGEALERRVRPLAEQLGSDLLIECDVSDMAALDAAFDQLKTRFPQGAPSLLDCLSFEVQGDVVFGEGVVVRGKVVIGNRSDSQRALADGTVIEKDLILT